LTVHKGRPHQGEWVGQNADKGWRVL